MKSFSLFFLLASATAHAGAKFELKQMNTLCLSEVHPTAEAAVTEAAGRTAAKIKAACGDFGGMSTLKSFEVKDAGACGFGLNRIEYTFVAECYII